MNVAKEIYGSQGMYHYVPKKDIFASIRNPIVALPRRVLVLLSVLVSFSILWLLLSFDRLPSFLSLELTSTTTTHWRGWANVDNLIVLYATNI